MKKIIVSLVFVLLLNTVSALEVRLDWTDYAYIESFEIAYNTIGTDAKTEAVSNFIVKNDFTKHHDNLTISYNPWVYSHNLPVQDFNLTLCEGHHSGSDYDGMSLQCNIEINYSLLNYTSIKTFNVNGVPVNLNASTHRITFVPKDNTKYVIKFEYLLPNFIFRQGDLYVVWFNYQNMDYLNNAITTYVLFPSESAIPKFFPDDAEIDRRGYVDRDGKWKYRWGFIFKGQKDRILTYYDFDEMEKAKLELTNRGSRLGAKYGAIFSLLLFFLVFLPITLIIKFNKDKIRLFIEEKILNKKVVRMKEKLEALKELDSKKMSPEDRRFQMNVLNQNVQLLQNIFALKINTLIGYTAIYFSLIAVFISLGKSYLSLYFLSGVYIIAVICLMRGKKLKERIFLQSKLYKKIADIHFKYLSKKKK